MAWMVMSASAISFLYCVSRKILSGSLFSAQEPHTLPFWVDFSYVYKALHSLRSNFPVVFNLILTIALWGRLPSFPLGRGTDKAREANG